MGQIPRIEWRGTEWRAVPGHEGYYASADGRILSTKRKQPREIRPIISKDGHRYVFMYGESGMKKVWLHRAVLSAYRGEEEKALECRHLDDNPANNHVSNLEWGDRKQNTADKKRNGGIPYGERSGSHKVNAAQVMEIRQRYADGESLADLGPAFGISKNAALEIVKGKTWPNLPIIPAERHMSTRKTPLSKEHVDKFLAAAKKNAAERRKPRTMVPCACGCGGMIETPDNKGRERKFIHGHNQANRTWRWRA